MTNAEFYERLEGALTRLPTKRLITGTISDGQDYCAMGAYVRDSQLGGRAGSVGRDVMFSVYMDFYTGVSTLWNGTAMVNNRFVGTPEERYEYMLGWARAQRIACATAVDLPVVEKEQAPA